MGTSVQAAELGCLALCLYLFPSASHCQKIISCGTSSGSPTGDKRGEPSEEPFFRGFTLWRVVLYHPLSVSYQSVVQHAM